MAITDWATLTLYPLVGALLGAIHFGGLWWTVRRLPAVRRPALWIGASFVLRTALVMAVFYLIIGDGWLATLAAMIGFIAVRPLFGRHPVAPPPNRC